MRNTPQKLPPFPFLRLSSGSLIPLIAAAWVLVAAGAAYAKQGSVVLKEDVPTSGVLDLEADPPLADFAVTVPKDALLMTVKVSRTPVTLDVLARKKQPMETVNDADYRSNADTPSKLLISRQSSPALEDGTYHVAVTFLGVGRPVVHRRPVKKVPFTVTVSFVRSKVDGVLAPGKKLASQTRVEQGGMRNFAVDVPAGAKALRIDLDEVSGVLDIWASRRGPVVHSDDADETAISALGRKTLLIEGSALKPGRWYVQIVRPTDVGTVDFAVYASLSAEPPAALLALPSLVPAADARKRAIQATVDVAVENGGGSGTMLVAGGLILTNYHVVEAETEESDEKEPVVIGLTLDPRQPARELFRGHVLVRDKKIDLALVEVACGLYHQPLPQGYRFPTLALGDPDALEVGDKVTTIGFPEIGNTNGWASVTLTQGVLSGFEKSEIGTLMKTDAGISPGSSGGAALDSRWRLIGVPTFESVSPEEVSRMAYIHPITLLPEAWRKIIRQHEQALGTQK
jgi:S1-C subfamily serine protease